MPLDINLFFPLLCNVYMNTSNVSNLLSIYRTYLNAENKNGATIRNYISDINHFWGHSMLHSSNSPTVELAFTTAAIEKYKKDLCNEQIPLSTINRRLSSLRNFCAFCVAQHWLPQNPMNDVLNVSALPAHDAQQSLATLVAEAISDIKSNTVSYSQKDHDVIIRDIHEFVSIINS